VAFNATQQMGQRPSKMVQLFFAEALKFRSLLKRSGITKNKGYATISLMFLFVLLPFLKRKLTEFWSRL
jgi:hypothetical protein